MKYLLVLLVVVFGFWLWKHNRRSAQLERKAQATPPQTVSPSSPAEMIRCLHCGVHLPQSDAVQGKLGPYCSAAHRSVHET